jgi:hypothetical protein
MLLRGNRGGPSAAAGRAVTNTPASRATIPRMVAFLHSVFETRKSTVNQTSASGLCVPFHHPLSFLGFP